jgi:hypothetical protein
LKSKDPEIGIAAPEAKLGKPLPPTRPYLYDVGKGVLMLSVAQGPDAIFEPYGVLRSTDAGKTWEPWASPCAMSSISMTLASRLTASASEKSRESTAQRACYVFQCQTLCLTVPSTLSQMPNFMSHTNLVADIKIVTPHAIAKGLPSPWDTKLVQIETQTLARGSI